MPHHLDLQGDKVDQGGSLQGIWEALGRGGGLDALPTRRGITHLEIEGAWNVFGFCGQIPVVGKYLVIL